MIASLSGLPVPVLVLLFLAALGAFGWLLWSQIKHRGSESAPAPSELEPQPAGEYPPDLAPASAPLDTGALVAQIQQLFDSYRAAADEDLSARLQEFGRSLPKAQAGDHALTAAVGRLEKTMGELRGRLDELAAVVARQSEAAAVHAAAPSGPGAAGPVGDADVREALEYFYIRLADQFGTLKRAVEDVKGARPSELAGRPPEGPV